MSNVSDKVKNDFDQDNKYFAQFDGNVSVCSSESESNDLNTASQIRDRINCAINLPTFPQTWECKK